MDPISLAFLSACVALLTFSVLTVRTDPHAHRVVTSLALFFAWGSSHYLAARYGWELARLFAPLTDCLGGVLVANLYVIAPALWKRNLVWLFGTKLALHVGYHLAVALGANPWFQYQLSLNVLYGAELLCVAFPGGSIGVAIALDWLASLAHAPSGVIARVPGGHRVMPAVRRQGQGPTGAP